MSEMDGFTIAPIDNFGRTIDACAMIMTEMVGGDFRITHMSVGKRDGKTHAFVFHPGNPDPHMQSQELPIIGNVAATSRYLMRMLNTMDVDQPPVTGCVKGWVFSALNLGDVKSLKAEAKYAAMPVTNSIN